MICTFASSKSADLFGLPLEDLLGSALADLAGEDAAAVIQAADQARAGAQATEAVFRARRASDECRWIEVRYAPLADGGFVAAFRDITLRHTASLALRVANGELNKLAGNDPLTELPNRRRFEQALETECRRASRNEAPLSLLLIAIDDDDPRDREAGDNRLKQVASLLRDAAARPAEIAACLGGDEFALLLPQTDESEAARTADELQKAAAALALPCRAGAKGIKVDIGCATIRPTLDSLHDVGALLLAEADRALRLAGCQDGEPAGAPRGEQPGDLAATGGTLPTRIVPGLHQTARIAAVLLNLPTAFVVLREETGLVIAGHFGLDDREIGEEWYTWGLAAEGGLVVPDTDLDPGFRRVGAEAGFGFVAAAPLCCKGAPIGALWVADRIARPCWGENEPLLLRQLAGLATEGMGPARSSDAGGMTKVA